MEPSYPTVKLSKSELQPRSCKRSETLFKSLLFWLAGEVSWYVPIGSYQVVHHPSSIILVCFPLNITASYFTVNCFEIQKLYILVFLMMKITFQYLIQFWGSDFCSKNDHWALERYRSCCK